MSYNNLFNSNISKYYFMYLKIFFIVYLIISSILIKNTDFINNNLEQFIYENIICFICMAVIPILIMSYFRNFPIYNINTVKRIFVFGILFCGIHTLLEINGFYKYLYNTSESFIEKFSSLYEFLDRDSITKNKFNNEYINKKLDIIEHDNFKLDFINKHFKSLIIVLIISFIIMMLYIMLTGILNGLSGDNFGLSYKYLFFEAILVGIFSSIPVIYFAYNRSGYKITDHSLVETLLLCFKYISLHYILHYSGFYLSHFSK